MKPFGRIETRLVVEAKIKAEAALHVGCGGSLEPSGTDSPVIRTADGKPFIPGSSIKGVLRSFAEQLLRTMQGLGLEGPQPPPKSGVWACEPFASTCCVSKDDKDSFWEEARKEAEGTEKNSDEKRGERKPTRDEIFAQKLFEHACYACRLFGCQYFAGRIALADAFPDGEVTTQVRDGVGIDRDTGTAKEGIKYDFEVVEPGAKFDLRIVCENLEEAEEAFFAHLLKLWQDEGIHLGAKTARGLGLTKLTEIEVKRYDADALVGMGKPQGAQIDVLADKLNEHWR